MGQKCICKKETKWNTIHCNIEFLVLHSAIYQFLKTLSVCLQAQINIAIPNSFIDYILYKYIDNFIHATLFKIIIGNLESRSIRIF